MGAYDDVEAWLREVLAQLGQTKPELGFQIEAAWFDEEGILKFLIAMPLDPPSEMEAVLGGPGGGGESLMTQILL